MRYLLDNIRDRKFDRVAVGYTVAAWAVIQATSVGASAFAWPMWVLQAVIVAGVGGLPIVLLGAWTLGVRRNTEGHGFRPSRADWHMLGLMGPFLLVASAAFIFVFWPRPTANTLAAQTVAGEPPPNSIAVLPFANLGGDANKLYFSQGIAEQLINALSQIPALRVAARTSSFSFQGKSQSLTAIARALNVRSVLEGSVLAVGDRIRIAVQLEDSRTGFQIWSKSYDRDLSDILAVQDSISAEIANAISERLLGKKTIVSAAAARTIDPESYRMFLQGRFYAARDDEADYRRAASLFQRVTLRAPNYADGFAEYGNALNALAADYGDSSAFAASERATRRALALDGRNLRVLHTMMVVSISKWDWLGAADWFRRSRAINPNSSVTLHSQSVLASAMNFPQQDFEAEKKAADLDPLSFIKHFNLAVWYFEQARFDDAAKAARDALLLQPSNAAGSDLLCTIQVARHKLSEAHRIAASLATGYSSNPDWRAGCPMDIALAEGRKADARKIVDEVARAYSPGGGATAIGSAYRRLGDLDRAMLWYERAYSARERELLQVPQDRRQSPALLANPRWKALWKRQPIRDWEEARHEVRAILNVGT
ncbi:MAG: hypothetical protein JO056_05125 [Alphaproteobacteria bacterium]|nr:hypothetical protein [Alphaproteobacteria bacterium]